MKVSYRTHPIIEKIETGYLGNMGVPVQDQERYSANIQMFDKLWGTHYASAIKSIKYLTNPFSEALIGSMPKIIESGLWKEMLNEANEGTIIRGAAAICYNIQPLGDGKISILVFEFRKHDTGELILDKFFFKNEGNKKLYAYCSSAGFDNGKSPTNPKDVEESCTLTTKGLLSILAFIKYADVQTKELPAGQKEKEIDCKYINETKSNIKILDSTWFTNLVKSDAFKVRGHFRLQPKKKDGVWTKELIWINEFQKEGYTRRAGKIIENES